MCHSCTVAHLAAMYGSIRRPDFLLSVLTRQGPSRSIGWLSKLVETRGVEMLDALPAACLCEFLVYDRRDGFIWPPACPIPSPAPPTRKKTHFIDQPPPLSCLISRLYLTLCHPCLPVIDPPIHYINPRATPDPRQPFKTLRNSLPRPMVVVKESRRA